MSKYQINIENNNRKEIVIENFKSINDDIESLKVNEQKNHKTFFCDEYYKASLILEKITKNGNVSEIESCNKDHDCKNYKKNKKFNNSNAKNNIIIFSGERGSGKTSAMVSFGKYLENEKGKENDKKTCRYKLLEMIDPSYFRKNESILLNVLTVMFKMARIYIEEAKYSEDIENMTSDFNELLRDFDKVFKSVNKMESIIPEENSLEYLNELSNSVRLNESIYYLTQKFLKLFNDKHEYMVIMIDDLDMNISHASAMLEQIRKFLIHDNILILIATNIEQLQFEIKESYSRYYEKILHPMQNQPSVSVDVDDMATKYLLKLFPPLQRVHIGEAANKLINTKLNLKIIKPKDEKDENGKIVKKDKKDEKEEIIEGDLQRVILNLIWSKTRLLFINEDDQLHPIIPTNLRALHQLIYMLIEMDDIEKDKVKNILFKEKNDYIKAQYNFNKFKDYILNIWIPSNVSFDEKKVFDNIPKDLGRINKHFIQSINVIGSKYKKTILIKDIDFEQYLEEKGKNDKFDRDIYTFVSPNDPKFSNANKISDIYNFPSNNTVGDILLLTDKYKTYFEATNQTKFIEAVKIYYTLLLFETMFFSKKENQGENSYKIDNISPIQRLIGGTFYFPHYFNLIKSSQYDKLKKKDTLKESIIKILNKTENNEIKVNLVRYINDLKNTSKDELENASEDDLKNAIEELYYLSGYNYTTDNNKEKNTLNMIMESIINKPQLNASKDSEDYLSYFLFDKKDKIEKESEIFFILYYGKSRPPRSFGKHIYNTRFKDLDSESNDKSIRFDILSLLVNSLNPEQTIARFGTENSTILGFDYNQIINWAKKYNNIDESIPNFILPIYSVDLLLTYLRKTYDISDLIKDDDKIVNKNIKNNTIKDISKYHDLMRTRDLILLYYNNLNELTQTALSKIEIINEKKQITQDNNMFEVSLYEDIFINGIDAFITLLDEEKTHMEMKKEERKKEKEAKAEPDNSSIK